MRKRTSRVSLNVKKWSRCCSHFLVRYHINDQVLEILSAYANIYRCKVTNDLISATQDNSVQFNVMLLLLLFWLILMLILKIFIIAVEYGIISYADAADTKMTVRGTIVRSEVCNAGRFCLESKIQKQHQHFMIFDIIIILLMR